MPYLDTHQHLIYRDAFGYSWTKGIAALEAGDFTLEDYNAIVGDRVAKTIFMECGVDDADYQAETRFVASKVGVDPKLAGVIASCRPETDAGFDAWLEECQDLPVVGFRRILHVVDDGMSQAAGFRRNVQKIGAAGKVFDMCFLEAQLPVAYELAKACDNTELVLNHCGVPNIAGGEIEPWRSHMRRLAECDNVVCKLSGISAYTAPEARGLANYRAWIDAVFEIFGTNRIIWGSDWPVVDMGQGLTAWLDESDEILSGLSDAEASKVAFENAAKIYGV